MRWHVWWIVEWYALPGLVEKWSGCFLRLRELNVSWARGVDAEEVDCPASISCKQMLVVFEFERLCRRADVLAPRAM